MDSRDEAQSLTENRHRIMQEQRLVGNRLRSVASPDQQSSLGIHQQGDWYVSVYSTELSPLHNRGDNSMATLYIQHICIYLELSCYANVLTGFTTLSELPSHYHTQCVIVEGQLQKSYYY